MTDAVPTLYLPVAYLPGASGRSAVWGPIATVLAHRREALLFDYPGLGDCAESPEIRSLSDLRHWIARELPERCDLVAQSMGSLLAIWLALAHPERIRRLVLVAPCGGLNAQRFGALDWRDAFRRRRPDAPTWLVDDKTDFGDRLHALHAPTLLIFGGDDLIAPLTLGEFLREELPSAKLEVIKGATHDVEEEHPTLVASMIEAHLRR